MAKKKFQPRARKLLSTSQILERLVDRHQGGAVKKRMALWENWDSLMGPVITGLGTPLGSKDGVITIGAEDTLAMQELSMLGPNILARANSFLQEETFTRVKLVLHNKKDSFLKQNKKATAEKKYVPPAPPSDFGKLVGTLDQDSLVGRCYLALHDLYFPPRS